ncbi:flagellar protein FlaG [bacterium]|nr:flagellar protein FlaG [bacterium]
MISAPIDGMNRVTSQARSRFQAPTQTPPPEDQAGKVRETQDSKPAPSRAEMTENAFSVEQKAARTKRAPVSTEELAKKIREIVEEIQQKTTSVRFDIDEVDGEILVKVVNRESGELVRQIPPEDVLNLREKLTRLTGVFFENVT